MTLIYVSTERYLAKWLPARASLHGVRVLTDTGQTITQETLAIQQTAGTSHLGMATAIVNVRAIVPGTNRAAALDLAAAAQACIEEELTGDPMTLSTRAGAVDLAVAWRRTITAPVWIPDENTTLRSALMTVELFTHAREHRVA